MNKSIFKHIFMFLLQKRDFEKYSDAEFSEIINTANKQAKITVENVRKKTFEVYEYYKKLNITDNTNTNKILEVFNQFDTKQIYCLMILIENINNYSNDEIIITKIKNFSKSKYKNNDLAEGLEKSRNLIDYIVESEKVDIKELYDSEEYIKKAKNRCISHANSVFQKVESNLKNIDEKINDYCKSIEIEMNKFENDKIMSNDDVFLQIIRLLDQLDEIKDTNIHYRRTEVSDLIDEISDNLIVNINQSIETTQKKIANKFVLDVQEKAQKMNFEMERLNTSILKNFEHFKYEKVRFFDKKMLNHKIHEIFSLFNQFDHSVVQRIIVMCLDHIDMISEKYEKLNNNQKIDYDDVARDVIKMKKVVQELKKENNEIVQKEQAKKDFFKNFMKKLTFRHY